MIIVLFHVFYLFGQYIYKNYRAKRLRASCDVTEEAESSFGRQTEMLNDNSRDNNDDEKPPATKYQKIEPLKLEPPAYLQNAVEDVLNNPTSEGKMQKIEPVNFEPSSGQQTYSLLNNWRDDNDDDDDDDDDEKSVAPKYPKMELKFEPPAYIQRYSTVQNILNDPIYEGKLRKVVDFGCANLNFLRYLKNTQGVEEILCVDIDREVLEYNKIKAEPYLMEYVCCRETPLVIELCEGSVTHNDRKLEQTDAVICIELIEHLYPDTLTDLPFNIFEYIMPKVAIITTPNADFNVLFPNFSGYRHPDHKFEWTKEQFQDWAQNIVVRYPSYNVTFHGICKGPAGTEELGSCTQMAVFHRHSLIAECNKIIGVDGLFKTVVKYDYPINIDNRTDEEKLLHEATYHITKLSCTQENRDEVILSDILPYLEEKKFNVTIETLKKLLIDADWIIKDGEAGPIVILDSFSDHEDEDEYHMDSADLINEENELNYENKSISEISANVDEEEDLHERNSYNENWNEQPSIIIPENRSFIQENTYLFDGDSFLSEHQEYQSFEESHVTGNNDVIRHSKISTVTESLIYAERELPSNSTSLSLNEIEIHNRAEIIDTDVPIFGTSSIMSNGSLILKNSSVDNTTIESALSQNSDINLATGELQVQKNTMFNFQPYMSVSRSSTSPLFFSSESNNSLHNYSTSYQNGSCDKFHQLNSTFHQSEIANEATMNVEESFAKDTLSLPFKKSFSEKDYVQRSEINPLHMFSNYSKVNNSCNFEQMTSVKNQIYENNDMADMVPLNVCSNSVNNQPRFTSSPKAIKTSTNIMEQSCLELKELMPTVNRSILPCIKEAIKETISDNSLKDISQKSSSSNTTETVKLCTSSLSDDITNTSKNNVDLCLISNNAQQHLCLEKELIEVVESTQGTDEKFIERNIVINRESDIADVRNLDAHHNLSSDNENINNKEENVDGTLTKTNDNGTKLHEENVINDFAQSNIRKQSLNPSKELLSLKSQNNSECSSIECAKKTSVLENDRLVSSNSNKDINSIQFASVLKKSDEIVGTSKDVNISNIAGLVNNIEVKSVSPFETPPNSWSPEIMDSGYPNSASVQDITPEYDLSSIAQDHIPDSESPSIAEAPRLGILEPIEVENGDLANNNRDDEGNNMMAVDANDIENLQPFIEVLENDLENENDIYVVQNGFPIWLLRLLDMANPLDFDMQGRQNLRNPEDEVADDANYVGHDEGFDSSSSENESDL